MSEKNNNINEQLDEICETYFKNKVKQKHLSRFKEKTPDGNVIEGYINRKPNFYMGSLLITKVNDKCTYQFIQSMPKIHYLERESDIDNIDINYCREKLDGTCLILYPLLDPETNELLEVVPKTRGRAVADSHFIELYDKIDKKPIRDYYNKDENGDSILIFELFGVLNQHEILNYCIGIDVRLIGAYKYGKFVNNSFFAFENNFKLPDNLFKLYRKGLEWNLVVTTEKYSAYLEFGEKFIYPTVIDAVDGIKNILEDLNKEFIEINGYAAIEGVVINTTDESDAKRWIKVKPKSILDKHQSVKGVPRSSITKEVLKYFDEYGSQVQEIYLEDENHHTDYLYRMLCEEYPVELVEQSNKRIERVFMQIWNARSVPESIHIICEDLVKDNPGVGVADLMRVFARKYPMKKRDSRLVYSVLQKMI